MLPFSKFSTSYSYQVNYQFQADLYSELDKKTENIQWLRPPAFFFFNISSIATVVARTAAIAETFFKGFGMLLLSPFASSPLGQVKNGLEELVVQTLKNVIRLSCFPLEYLIDGLFCVISPKHFIIQCRVYACAYSKRAIAKTLDSEDHDESFTGYGLAGDINAEFLAYQRRH